MKTLFTYPNNPDYHYIQPAYLGDGSNGFSKRAIDFVNGDYNYWFGGRLPTVNGYQALEAFSKYHQHYQESWGENTFYQFWNKPMVEATFRAIDADTIEQITLENVGGTVKMRLSSTDDIIAHANGTNVALTGFTTEGLNGLTGYWERIDDYNGYFAVDAGFTNYNFSELQGTIYDITPKGGNQSLRAIRYGDATMLKFNSAPNWDTGVEIQHTTGWTDPLDTGTSATVGTCSGGFFLEQPYTTEYSFIMYTDSARTTGATLNEHYVTTGSRNFTTGTGSQVFDLGYELWADWGITDLAGVQAEGNGWLRLTATVNSGTFTGAVNSTDTITTTKSYTTDFYWQYYSGARFGVWNQRNIDGPQLTQDFELGPNSDVTITIEVINPARTVGGLVRHLCYSPLETGNISQVGFGAFELDQLRIISPGNTRFQYQDSNNITQSELVITDQYILPGENFTRTLVPGQEQQIASNALTIDIDGYITGIDITDDKRGYFNSPETRLLVLASPADQYYAAPTPLADEQDIWDMDTEWDSNGYNGAKEWPHRIHGVTPKSAKLTYTQPSSVTASQNGTKYVRSLGFQKWELEVEYPPLTEEQFRLLHVTAQNARGQFTPFYFINRDAVDNALILDYHNPNALYNPRIKQHVYAGQREMLLEGYPTNQYNVVKKGELAVTGYNNNGAITTMMTDVDANAYGEARVKIPYALNGTLFPGDQVYFTPYHFVVTLADDGFEYEIDSFGFYFVKVRFIFDEWK